MHKYLQAHIRMIEGLLAKKKKGTDWVAVRNLHRTRIDFFQHERLIHLIVTLFFGLINLLTTFAASSMEIIGVVFLMPILLIMLVVYVWHYFQLENGVQKLYRLDDEIEKILENS